MLTLFLTFADGTSGIFNLPDCLKLEVVRVLHPRTVSAEILSYYPSN